MISAPFGDIIVEKLLLAQSQNSSLNTYVHTFVALKIYLSDDCSNLFNLYHPYTKICYFFNSY